jgi:ADP-heptose:LPS heptosyltransferase/SAM-dependent methyltransferase
MLEGASQLSLWGRPLFDESKTRCRAGPNLFDPFNKQSIESTKCAKYGITSEIRGLRMLDPSAAPQEIRQADQDVTPRQQIDSIQLLSLGTLFPRRSFGYLVVSRLEKDFFAQPLRRKIKFLAYAARWILDRARARIANVSRPAKQASANVASLRVAVHGTGSIGDFLTHMMFIQEFCRQFGPMQIDFYCHPKKMDDAKFVFAQAQFVKHVINVELLPTLHRNYDLIVYLRYVVKYEVVNHWRISQHSADLLNVIGMNRIRLQPYQFIFDSHPFLDGMFARIVTSENMSLPDATGHFGGLKIDRDTVPYFCADVSQYSIVKRLGLAEQRYITVHDGFDTSHISFGNTATKCWPLDHWRKFVALVKEKLPDIAVVQLGSVNSREIAGVDLDLRKKTTLDEAAWILKNSLLHIDGESGLVRLAHALHTKSVVLFGPTNLSFFGFDKNINLASKVCNDCWWSTRSWLNSCPRGFTTPVCMETISPESVAHATADYLKSLQPSRYELEALSLYGDDDIRDRLVAVLADIFRRLHLPPVPISQHTENRDNGIYLHASKQWEYLKAWDMIDAMSNELNRPLRIADVGGGRGALSPYLALKGHEVEVFDVNYLGDHSGEVDIASKFQKAGVENGWRVSYGSLFNVPAESDLYDAVLSVSVLRHAPYRVFAIREALRLLRTGGKLFMSFDFAADAASKEDDQRVEILTPERLSKALAEIGIFHRMCSTEQVEESAVRVRQDRVSEIPIGMTVGSLVISRLVAAIR